MARRLRQIRPVECAPDADGTSVTWWFLLVLAQSPQGRTELDPRAQAARLRAQMQASLVSQRQSVQAQAARTHPARSAQAQVFTSGLEPAAWRSPSLLAVQSAPDAPACDPVPPPEMTSLVDFAAQENNVNPLLIREVARQESGFRPCALSSQGAMGLMQLMPETQAGLGVAHPWDPRESIEAGSRLLRQLLDRYHGDVSLALGAYNAGPGRVDQFGGVPPIPETQNYVDRIMNRLAPSSAPAGSGFPAAYSLGFPLPGGFALSGGFPLLEGP